MTSSLSRSGLGIVAVVLAVAMKKIFDRSKGSSKYLSVKELFCSGSRTSKRAEAGSPLKSLPTLSISSNKNTGSFLPAFFKREIILPGRAPI